jgi:hypothetical protein
MQDEDDAELQEALRLSILTAQQEEEKSKWIVIDSDEESIRQAIDESERQLAPPRSRTVTPQKRSLDSAPGSAAKHPVISVSEYAPPLEFSDTELVATVDAVTQAAAKPPSATTRMIPNLPEPADPERIVRFSSALFMFSECVLPIIFTGS